MTPHTQDNTTRAKKREIAPEPIPIEDGKRLLIPLTRGFFAKIDAVDLPLIGERCWNANERDNGKMYAQQVIGKGKNCKTIYMHRVIMGVTDPNVSVDHEDREDTLNNTRYNLRTAGKDQQMFNSKIRSDCGTGFKGVAKDKKCYVPYLNYKGVRVHVGRCADPSDAARLRDRAAIELHGEFASLNFPRSDYDNLPVLGLKVAFEEAVRVRPHTASFRFENGKLLAPGQRDDTLFE